MRFLLLICLFMPIHFAFSYSSLDKLEDFKAETQALSMSELEARRDRLEDELSGLAEFSMNSGVGRIGYRSKPSESAEQQEWIEIRFNEKNRFNEIVLIPTIWRDGESGYVADAFPSSFEIVVGDGAASRSLVVVKLSDEIISRQAPYVITFPETEASWIRLIAKQLSPRMFDGRFSLHFSEMLVFQDNRNIALGQEVYVSSSQRGGNPVWHETFLVDGFVPYLMNTAFGKGSLPFTSRVRESVVPEIVIDLEKPHELEEAVIHVVEQSDNVPQAYAGDFGIPYRFILEGSSSEDFSNSHVLLVYNRRDKFDVAPLMPLQLRSFKCRYVRLRILDAYMMSGYDEDGSLYTEPRVGFAEIELLENGRNVALNKPVRVNMVPAARVRESEALNDGKNLYGDLIPIRTWLNQLALRNDLELELPLVVAELQTRYTWQTRVLTSMKILLVVVIFLAVLFIFLVLHFQQGMVFRIRERITADLHDELGANVSAIVLLSEMARSQKGSSGNMDALIDRIHALASRTRKATKHCTDMLNTPGLYGNLSDEMRRISNRMLADLEYSLEIEGEEVLNQFKQRDRVDILLFYKECLINILKHSHATKVTSYLTVDEAQLDLTVHDNGTGIPTSSKNPVPPSIARRARMLGAVITVESSDKNGTCIRLKFNRRRLFRLPMNLPIFLGRYPEKERTVNGGEN